MHVQSIWKLASTDSSRFFDEYWHDNVSWQNITQGMTFMENAMWQQSMYIHTHWLHDSLINIETKNVP
jgi:hypothetical protein